MCGATDVVCYKYILQLRNITFTSNYMDNPIVRLSSFIFKQS